MNLLLFVLMVLSGEAVYFEYTSEQRLNSGCQHQLSLWQEKVDALQSEGKKLTQEDADLTQNITRTQTENKLLTAEYQNAMAKAAILAQQPAAAATPEALDAAQNSSSSVNLGTINTILGQTFQNCKLLKIQTDGITFSHTQGITKVLFPYLRPELQKRFGYDPQKATAAAAANLRYQEEVRQAEAQRNETPSAGQTPP